MKKIRALGCATLLYYALPFTQAAPLLAPSNSNELAQLALSESTPTGFAPTTSAEPWTPEDFEVRGLKESLKATWIPGSLEWVRVNEIFLIPRARLLITYEGKPPSASGSVRVAEMVTPFRAEEGRAIAEVEVALLVGPSQEFSVTLSNHRYPLFLEFAPSGRKKQRAFTDSSCSRFGVQAELKSEASWVYLGCRMIESLDQGKRKATLEVWTLWSGADSASLNAQPVTPTSSGIFILRASPRQTELTLTSKNTDTLRIRYSIRENAHRGFVGLGLGPYHVSFSGAGEALEHWTAMPTLYASYTLSESVRIVGFDATTLNSHLVTDVGIYLSTEQIRTLDRRVFINLMLGVHATGFKSQGDYHFLLGAPQGVEIIATDIGRRGSNLTFGGFIYPPIQGKAYTNVWTRWGNGQLFWEMNYISWRETVGQEAFRSGAFGLSAGFPLGRFL